MPAIDKLLGLMVQRAASDLHLTSSFKPFLRVDGEIQMLNDWPVHDSDQIVGLLNEIMPEYNRRQFEREWDTDFAYEVAAMGRFRVNVYHDRFGVGTVMRLIPSIVPTMDQLNLPGALRDFCRLSKGLVLVTGPTGSGKSTTLAAMIDYINHHRTEHVITIEDPIEFVHEPIRCLINQREVHRDTTSFSRALRAALREDPDVVLVGEMRDLETVEIAIETAETGHLVFGTVHTNSAPASIDRVIDKFPSARQNQIRSLLGDSLKGVVAQTLCKQIGGGRIAAFEVLVVNIPVAAHIREGKTFLIPSVMQTSRNIGMQTFSWELTRLVMRGKITPEEAFVKAIDKEDIRISLQNAGIPLEMAELHDVAVKEDRSQETAAQIAHLRTKISQEKNDAEALNDLAWLLASNPVDSLRSGSEAVRMSERANKITGDNPAYMDTLGVAYAELGSFRRAMDITQRALNLAVERNLANMVGPLTLRLRLYRDRLPFRDV